MTEAPPGGCVVLRISNRIEPHRCITPGFFAFDRFHPNVDELAATHFLSRHCSVEDFNLTLGAINSLVGRHRTPSIAYSVGMVVLLLCCAPCFIWVNLYTGISLSVGGTFAHQLLQMFERYRAMKEVQAFLDDNVNPVFKVTRKMTMLIDSNSTCFSTWFEVDFVAVEPSSHRFDNCFSH